MSSSTISFVRSTADLEVMHALGRRRKRMDRLITVFCYASAAIGLFFLGSILFTLFWRGLEAMGLSIFTNTFHPTMFPDAERNPGGMAHAIVGTLIQVGIATLVGTPIGLFVGTYLAEYGRGTALGNTVRFVSDILISAPSVLIGLFIYQLVVLPMGGFTGIAGALALAIIVIPVVVRTTEDMLTLIPNTLREAVIGLGSPRWKMITLVCYKAALSGIATGVLLAVARITGETAPLLLTSFGNNVMSLDLLGAMASLPIAVYQNANSGFPDLVAIAWAGALLVTLGVLIINILTRVLLRSKV
jgi:phosphate transport system permease protein